MVMWSRWGYNRNVITHLDHLGHVVPHPDQLHLVDGLGHVVPRPIWCPTSTECECHVVPHLDAKLGCELDQDVSSCGLIRQRAVQVAVEAPGPQECRVDQIGPAGGGDHEDAFKSFNTVQSGQQLVDHTVSHARAVVSAAWSDGIQFVEE